MSCWERDFVLDVAWLQKGVALYSCRRSLFLDSLLVASHPVQTASGCQPASRCGACSPGPPCQRAETQGGSLLASSARRHALHLPQAHHDASLHFTTTEVQAAASGSVVHAPQTLCSLQGRASSLCIHAGLGLLLGSLFHASFSLEPRWICYSAIVTR